MPATTQPQNADRKGSRLVRLRNAIPVGVPSTLTVSAVALLATLAFDVPAFASLVGAGIILAVTTLPRAATPVAKRARSLDELGKPKAITGICAASDAINDPCFVAGSRGQVVHANLAARARFGRIDVGDPVSFKMRVPVFLEALERVTAGGPQEMINWSEKVPTERWFQAHLAPIRLQGESRVERGIKPDYVLILVRDLTEQNRLERMRADFVANASHELRTPLASLTGAIETLQGPAKNDSDARQRFLELMLDQATRMRRLIDDLLSLSRIEMKSHLAPTDLVKLEPLIRSVAEGLRQLAKDAEVTITMSFPQEPLEILGDGDELMQVFQNLVENAVKYGQSGKRVDISAERQEESDQIAIVVSIRDYGPGIPPQHVPRLTERFYRVDQQASRKAQGTGLGLAIVKHILTRHQTALQISSVLGEGSTFSVSFVEAPRDLDRGAARLVADAGR